MKHLLPQISHHQLQLAWPPTGRWVEVTQGTLAYCQRIRDERTVYTGATRIVKITTITEVIE